MDSTNQRFQATLSMCVARVCGDCAGFVSPLDSSLFPAAAMGGSSSFSFFFSNSARSNAFRASSAPIGCRRAHALQDFWCSNLINGSGACTDPAQGPTEIDANNQADMGLSDEDVADITRGWLAAMTAVQAAIVAAGAYTWSLIPCVGGGLGLFASCWGVRFHHPPSLTPDRMRTASLTPPQRPGQRERRARHGRPRRRFVLFDAALRLRADLDLRQRATPVRHAHGRRW